MKYHSFLTKSSKFLCNLPQKEKKKRRPRCCQVTCYRLGRSLQVGSLALGPWSRRTPSHPALETPGPSGPSPGPGKSSGYTRTTLYKGPQHARIPRDDCPAPSQQPVPTGSGPGKVPLCFPSPCASWTGAPMWEIPTAQNLQEPVTSVTSGPPTSDLLC